MATVVRHPRIMQKFYVYDPSVGDELGGLRVFSDKEKDGKEKDGTRHVLAVTAQVQYWIDQGLMGEKPVGELSDKSKKLLAQVTRGRSEDNDNDPVRVPRYDRKIQSGHPGFAGQPGYAKSLKKQRKDRLKAKNGKPPKAPKAPPQPPKTAA